MKYIIIVLFILSMMVLFATEEEGIIIPEDAIRLRIIANSNSSTDQLEKVQIKENIEAEIYELITDANNVSEVRNTIKENINVIKDIVEDYNVAYELNYGYNYFPTKYYKGVMYPAGNYESLVITLGNGAGDNFWCVLFPPLCLLEYSNEDVSDVEYQLYVKKLLDKF